MSVIINQMVVLFILMAVGFALGKTKILNPDSNKTLTKLILCIALPGTILNSVFDNDMSITIGETFFFLLMSFVTILIAFIVSVPIVRLMGGKKSNRGLLVFMSVFSNSAFMGIPVAIAIFDITAAFYASLFIFVWNIIVFSLGIVMISGKSGKFDAKILLNPAFITAIIAVPIALIGITPHMIITETVRIAGSMTTPVAMIVTGSILAYMPMKAIFSEWRIFPVTLLKLIIIPVVTWLIMRQILTNELQLGVIVLIAGMPIAAMAPMLAVEYDGNEPLASSGVFITTLLSGITIPLLVYFLLM
ncbi:MAG: AEC family transporter [Oscillospiraceae bacterium]|nr:AEC family transporter [Oscillospiraceae bacterium]